MGRRITRSATQRLFSRLRKDRRGGVATIFAIALPLLLVVTVTAVEMSALHSDKTRLQAVADATALNAATQMRFGANDQLLERSKSFALGELTDIASRPDTPEVTFLRNDGELSGIKVNLVARRMSFFGNLVPPGGFVLRAEAIAEQLGTVPLCVLGTSDTTSNALDFPGAEIIARSCLVHSNRNIALGSGSVVDAAAVQAVGAIDGGVPANAGTGAAPIVDPLSIMFDGTGPGPCTYSTNMKVDGNTRTAQPGVHCRHFDIERGTLIFAPGVHHLFSGELQLKKGAQIVGEDVTLVIWKDLKLKFDDGKVDLLHLIGSSGGTGEAAKWAGFAIAIDPQRTGDVTLNFNEIRRLEGVVYAPSVRLIVPGGINSTEVTPWTVVVAKELRIEGGRVLQINADYSTSAVPVPNGVGNRAAGGGPVRLTH